MTEKQQPNIDPIYSNLQKDSIVDRKNQILVLFLLLLVLRYSTFNSTIRVTAAVVDVVAVVVIEVPIAIEEQ